MEVYDECIRTSLKQRAMDLEAEFKADVIFYNGPIYPGYDKRLADLIDVVKDNSPNQNRIAVFLHTGGGVVEIVEKFVDIIRFHYSEVYFVVPDIAMSAGTIFCMSGDKIFMDYTSSLGPIDPQVLRGEELVPALGYLDQVQRMIDKSKKGQLSEAEFLMLSQLDLAVLSSYEQAKNLTNTLLKNWLVKYKFANWQTHRTNKKKLGKPVTQKEKEARAEEIAKKLADNKFWHSHGRMIGIDKLKDVLRLEIDDYSKNVKLRKLIRNYSELLIGYTQRHNYRIFLHNKNYF
ncbi:MAG: ATP-dependent Clp protease proteolytic subunit [Desulfomonile tiedjei]|uniref:ATP-dependent Clp protease proteolytic subunit n=1 Tax=Desulfomonile tiedjei TaxID=2358 RepID=A0A9D6Z323_9BACT|nr:ATP-dependent Clp protease proteolytic subunit [Desulfomonile tiedjei]